MKRKEITISTIFVIAFLLGLAFIASYAYIGSKAQVTGEANLSGTILDGSSFLNASGDAEMSLNISLDNLSLYSASNTGLSYTESTASIVLKYNFNPADYSDSIYCKYDISYTPEVMYTPSSTATSQNLIELGLAGGNGTDGFAEFNLGSVDKKQILYSSYFVADTTGQNSQTWQFKMRFHNLDFAQEEVFGQKPRGTVSLDIDYCKNGSPKKFNDYVASLTGKTINITEGSDTYTGAVVNESGIRYEGKNPNNYVSFNNELWRIIGEFDETTHGVPNSKLVKLVKADFIKNDSSNFTSAWDSNNKNNWMTASLNTLINNDYYNKAGSFSTVGLDSTAQQMIQPISWKLGGSNGTASEGNPNDYYIAERSSEARSGNGIISASHPVGLIYPSDYGFAVLEDSCPRSTQMIDGYNTVAACHTENWLTYSENYYTLTHNLGYDNQVAIVSPTTLSYSETSSTLAILPSIYLKTNVILNGGTGTKNDPYTLTTIVNE